MRIVAGKVGGRKLRVPKGRDVRPTLDRVREALFSSLGDRVLGARVLDLFAGTGALGLESLSRGADRAVFVEKDGAIRGVLKENVQELGFGGESRIVAKDALTAIRQLSDRGKPFDLVFMDPPYATTLLVKALDSVGKSNLLSPIGVIVAEHLAKSPPVIPKSLHLVSTKSYGDIALSVIEKAGTNKPDE